jgi:hypothetical protein
MWLCRVVTELMPLSNTRNLQEWVRMGRVLGKAGLSGGGDEGVIALMTKLPFQFIHSVLLPGQTKVDGHAVPMIFLMTTQGLRSGLDTSRRVSKGGDLGDNMVYFDGCHTAVNWVRYMASVYDHRNKNMLEIIEAFIQSESYEAVGQVMATWKQLGRLGDKGRDEEESVAPHDVLWRVGMMDSAQGPVSAVEEAFAHLKEEKRGRVLACKFHLHQCRRKHEVRHLKAEYHAEHKRRVELWIDAETKEDCETEFEELLEFYKEACSDEFERVMMSGWASFWMQR